MLRVHFVSLCSLLGSLVLSIPSAAGQPAPPPKLVEEIAAVDRQLAAAEHQVRLARSTLTVLKRSSAQEARALLALGRLLATRVALELKLRTAIVGDRYDATSVLRLAREAVKTLTLLTRHQSHATDAEVLSLLVEQHRILGSLTEMDRVARLLIAKHRCSAQAIKTSLTLGDYRFDLAGRGAATNDQLIASRRHYQDVVNCKGATAENVDLARYKLAWIAINLGDYQGAIAIFEQVVIRPTSKYRGEALVDLVFCVTEIKTIKPLPYLQRFKPTLEEQLRIYPRLATRLAIQQRYAEALPVWRLALATATNARRKPDVEEIKQRIEEVKEVLKKLKKR